MHLGMWGYLVRNGRRYNVYALFTLHSMLIGKYGSAIMRDVEKSIRRSKNDLLRFKERRGKVEK